MLEELTLLTQKLRIALESESWEDITLLQSSVQPLLDDIKAADKLDQPEYQSQLKQLQALYWELTVFCKDRRDHFKALSNKSYYQNAAAKAYSTGHKVV